MTNFDDYEDDFSSNEIDQNDYFHCRNCGDIIEDTSKDFLCDNCYEEFYG